MHFEKTRNKLYKTVSHNRWLHPILGSRRFYRMWFKHVRNSILEDLNVQSGPFKGMSYPQAKSIGSSLLPKIIGSYEKELSELVERLCTENYKEIVDIGCAEGYYAIGFGIRLKAATVFAFDTDNQAIRLCREMAQINNISSRCTWGDFCNKETLKKLPLTRALIICDCEGYEKELFIHENAADFINHDLLIEIHDLFDPKISSHIRDVFKETHSINVYTSISDSEKARSYSYEKLDHLPFEVKKKIFQEGRKATMEWFHLIPKK